LFSSLSRRFTLLALLTTMVLVIPQGSALDVGRIDPRLRTHDIPGGSVDPYLEKVLEGDHEERMRVLVRFSGWPIEDDIGFAREIGMDHLCTMKVLPVAWLEGTEEQIRTLSNYRRTEWMEYDGDLDLFMERSLTTINATVAWNSWIERTPNRYETIDGSGITVVVLDTGIDAGHPDLDYGEKTLVNLKADIPGAPWYELENSDTSYGHGTHCAGTIAGNGDASAGARSGVAPGANLIGLCVGDVGITLTNTYYGLEWVYENSRPPNPYNIKVVSNSWGGGAAEYNPQDATSLICQKITFENNVLVVFAMGNAGSGDHDGSELTASPTGLIPSNIGVAATERDGSGIAYFSSRGEKGKNHTYPDVAAPGVKIWSAHARLTEISAMSKLRGNPNPYYLAISGTSMATPHVSGLAALMFQAAPSLRISDRWEDYSGDDPEAWYSNTFNRIHEIEWIMEQSARYIQPDGIPLSDESGDNGVPEPGDRGPTEVGWDGKPIDWAQGYGLVDAEKCVGIALTLQELRDRWPQTEWNVNDAIRIYEEREVFHRSAITAETDILETGWEGEFARYAQDQDGPLLVQNQSRLIWIPEHAVELSILMNYDLVNIQDRTVGDLTFVIDFDNDGVFDYQHPFLGSRLTGTKSETLPIDSEDTGRYWAIGVYGQGFKVIRPLKDREFMELRIEYTMGLRLRMDVGSQEDVVVSPPPPSSQVSAWMPGESSPDHAGGRLILEGVEYDISRVQPLPEPEKGMEKGGFPWWWILLLAAAVLFGGAFYLRKRKGRRSRE